MCVACDWTGDDADDDGSSAARDALQPDAAAAAATAAASACHCRHHMSDSPYVLARASYEATKRARQPGHFPNCQCVYAA